MEYHATECMVLKSTAQGEADASFILYTKEFGKIRAYAQGIKKEQAKLRGHLETMSLVTITFVLGKNGERLTYAGLVRFWERIRTDSDKLTSALQMADMIDQRCFPRQKDPCVWNILMESFLLLDECDFVGEVFERFRRELSICLGTA